MAGKARRQGNPRWPGPTGRLCPGAGEETFVEEAFREVASAGGRLPPPIGDCPDQRLSQSATVLA